jgi:hypothetical protein
MASVLRNLQELSAMDINLHCQEVRNPESNTFAWIQDHPGYTETLQSEESGVFHITGKPGCGKTVLAKHIYRLLTARPRPSAHHVAFFACSALNDAQKTAMNIISSLILQICTNRTRLPGTSEGQIQSLNKIVSWKYGYLQELLLSLITFDEQDPIKPPKIIIIIDALDECDLPEERSKILETFNKIVRETQGRSSSVRFVITSRPYADILFSETNPMKLDLNIEDAMDTDLTTYIHEEVSRLIKKRPPFLAYREEIANKLLVRAEKMYLFVDLILELALRQFDSKPDSIEQILASLPTKLSEVYDEIWSKIGAAEEVRAKLILSWLLCAFRPLSEDELSEALARHDFNMAWNSWTPPAKLEFSNNIYSFKSETTLQRQVDQYKTRDLRGDLTRLFGPLIQVPQGEDGPCGPCLSHSRINLCHQIVKEHFLKKISFIYVAGTHFQMAELCSCILQDIILGDSDTTSIDTDDGALMILNDDEDYSEKWLQHRSIAVSLEPSFEGKVRLRRKRRKTRRLRDSHNERRSGRLPWLLLLL